jgi:hypothetical protein
MYTVAKLLQNGDKEKLLKLATRSRGEKERTKIKILLTCHQKLQARRQWSENLSVLELREGSCQPKILYPVKLALHGAGGRYIMDSCVSIY